jgi:serine/threonine protein kinase
MDSSATTTSESTSSSSVEDESPAPRALQSDPVDVAALVGGIVGGVLGLLAIISLVLVICLVRRRRNAKQERDDPGIEIPDRKTETLDGAIPERELEDLKQVGQGAFGKVYKGKYKHERVAVKTVHNEARGTDANILAEVMTLQKIKPHANVVSYRGFSTYKGQPALVLEYCEGGSLWDALADAEDDDWPTDRQLKVASGIAAGVAYLHDNNIIHRDLAARNVLLTGDDVARVTDFGLSATTEALDQMKVSSLAGAAAWMAPEQLTKDENGDYTFSKKSDVYSYGVVLFELFERVPPWRECKSHAEIVKKLTNGETLTTNDDKYADGVLSIVELCWTVEQNRPDMGMVARLLDSSHHRVSRRITDHNRTDTEIQIPSSQKSMSPYEDDHAPHPVEEEEEEKKKKKKKKKESGKAKNDPYFGTYHGVEKSESE